MVPEDQWGELGDGREAKFDECAEKLRNGEPPITLAPGRSNQR